jgi:hypothetical protein
MCGEDICGTNKRLAVLCITLYPAILDQLLFPVHNAEESFIRASNIPSHKPAIGAKGVFGGLGIAKVPCTITAKIKKARTSNSRRVD